VAARRSSVQTVDGVAAAVGGDLLLSHLRHRYRPGCLAAAYVRRPHVPAESPTLGLSHLQFEAMLVAARTSGNWFDFALVAMLGLLGLRIFEACGSNIGDSARNTATGCCECGARAARSSSCRCRPR
jgi:hypothetical protein